MQGRIDAFTIVFQPGGVFQLFSVPAHELTNDDFEGEAVLGRRFGELERRLGEGVIVYGPSAYCGRVLTRAGFFA